MAGRSIAFVAWFILGVAACQHRDQAVATSPADSASYQFEWLPSFDPPLYVRLSRTPAETVAAWVRWRADRSAPADSGRRRLAATDWKAFEAQLAAAKFWQEAPGTGGCGGDTVCNDGALWTIQGAEGARRHRVQRWSPSETGADGSFRGLALYMVQVSGAPIDSGRIH